MFVRKAKKAEEAGAVAIIIVGTLLKMLEVKIQIFIMLAVITPKRVTSGGAHLRGFALEQHNFEKNIRSVANR